MPELTTDIKSVKVIYLNLTTGLVQCFTDDKLSVNVNIALYQ